MQGSSNGAHTKESVDRTPRAGQTTETNQTPRDTPDEWGTLSKDVIFGLLSAKRRRRTLKYLATHDGQTTLGELADHIGSLENDTTPSRLNSEQRKRVYVALYQCHLPKMHKANVITYDQDRGTIQWGPNANQLYTYLATEPKTANGKDTPSEEASTIREKLTEFLSRQTPVFMQASNL
jgi:hypothetical protein